MSSNRRFAILWKAVSGASGSGIRTARMSSPGSRTDFRYPVKYDASGTSRSPFGPARTTDDSSASNAGGASPIGEPVPRLPPKVAPLRISRDANCGNSWSSSGTRPSSSRSASDSVSAAPISTLLVVERERAQLGQPVDGDHERRTGAPDVDLHAPVRAARHHGGVGPLGQQRDGFAEVDGPGEPGLADRHPGARGRRSSRGAAAGETVVSGRRPERVGRVADRPVPRAAAEVAAQCVQVEPVGAVLVVARRCGRWWTGPPRSAVRAVVLGSHAADESGRAVAALGTTADGHLPLHRVQGARAAEPLGRDDLLAVQRENRHEAGVQCRPPGAPGSCPAGRPAPSRRRTRLRRSPPWRRSGPGRGASPVR